MSEPILLVRNGDQVVAKIETEPDVLREAVRACLRELEPEREAVAHAADLERGDNRCLPSHAELLEGLLPETEGEA